MVEFLSSLCEFNSQFRGQEERFLETNQRGVKTKPPCSPAEKPGFGFLNGNEPSVYLLGVG